MDEMQFRCKLNQYKDTIYRIAYTYLRSRPDAEDVAQETFLKLYTRAEPFPNDDTEKAWLIRVTMNACHNLRRSVWYRNRVEMPENLPESYGTPEDNALYAAVFSLPDKYRVVVLLYYYEEYSVEEISQITGRNPSTIQTQLQRARKRLKALLEQKGGFHYGETEMQKCHGSDQNARHLRTENPACRSEQQ